MRQALRRILARISEHRRLDRTYVRRGYSRPEINTAGREASYRLRQEQAWERLSPEHKKLAVARLQAFFGRNDYGFLAVIADKIDQHGLGEWLPLHFHFGRGMFIRNILRSNIEMPDRVKCLLCIPDAELPPTEYDGHWDSNWDDYYIQVLEAAAGKRQL